MYLENINILLNTYEPLKRIANHKLKLKSKPWITLGLQKSKSVKNKLLSSLIRKTLYWKRTLTLNSKTKEISFPIQ